MKLRDLGTMLQIATDSPAVPTLWDEMGERTWAGFHESVRSAQERDAAGIRSALLTRIARAASAAEADGNPCPSRIIDLQRLLDRYDPE